ncbi:MAG: FixH family protein [Anaerolineae bacterium]|nr:FixH family protein [Anaerolineae bacterium]
MTQTVTIWEPDGAPGGNQPPHRNALRLPRKALLLWLALLLVAIALAGCGRAERRSPETQDSFVVTFATDPAPPAIGQGTVILTLHDATGRPVDDAKVAIEANMSHAGMVPVNAEATGGQAGVYRVPLRWTMGGDWYVDVRFTLPDGQTVGRRFPVSVR